MNPYVPVRLTLATVTSDKIGCGQRRSENFKSRAKVVWTRQFEKSHALGSMHAGISALSFCILIHLHWIVLKFILFNSHTNFGYFQHFCSAGREVFPVLWQCSSSTIWPSIHFCWWFKQKFRLMNQAYSPLIYASVISDSFPLVSIARSLLFLKCC